MYPYIGIIGAPGAGKDEVGAVLADALPDARVHSSAEPVKEVFRNQYCVGLSDSYKEWASYTQEGKASNHPYITWEDVAPLVRWSKTEDLSLHDPDDPVQVRTLQRLIGHALIAMDRLVLMRPIEPLHKRTGSTIIDASTRTIEQATFITDRGGIIIYVCRPEKEEEAFASTDDPHELFWANAPHSIRLNNTGTLDELHENTRRLAERLSKSAGPARAA
jgi:hypothetical protein